MTHFIFTNGCSSPHHQHMDYGLKEGFATASAQVIQKIEEVGFLIVRCRQESKGKLRGWGWNKPIGELHFSLYCSTDHQGRPNWVFEAQGLSETQWCQVIYWEFIPSTHSGVSHFKKIFPLLKQDQRTLNQPWGFKTQLEHIQPFTAFYYRFKIGLGMALLTLLIALGLTTVNKDSSSKLSKTKSDSHSYQSNKINKTFVHITSQDRQENPLRGYQAQRTGQLNQTCSASSLDKSSIRTLSTLVHVGINRSRESSKEGQIGQWWRAVREDSQTAISLNKLSKELNTLEQALQKCMKAIGSINHTSNLKKISYGCRMVCNYSITPLIYLKHRVNLTEVETWINQLTTLYSSIRSQYKAKDK